MDVGYYILLNNPWVKKIEKGWLSEAIDAISKSGPPTIDINGILGL